MEALVGRSVRKAFPGFGVYAGVVESYDAGAGYFRVLYEDGDSEEVDADEIATMLVGPAAMPPTPPPGDATGRRPKKRRRGDEESPPVPAVGGEAEAATPMEAREEVMVGAAEPAEKKRRVSPGPETSVRPLRRSARQAKSAARAAEMEAVAAVAAAADVAEAEAAAAATPQQSGRKCPRANGSGRYRSVSKDLEEAAAVERLPPKPELPPPKVVLPPSSLGFDFGGLPVLDLFQVYSCLRSFSRELFLSPFPLETFVDALQSTHVSSLINCVHFSLLRALKSHLEDFASAGDPSAMHCIRNLNWELLDLGTWPIYLAEYLLTRGSELRYDMKLTDLKLLSTEYYRQPAVVKLELLRSLSDDVLDIEAIRSKMSEPDGNDEGFRSTGLRRKKKGSSKGSRDSSPPLEGSDDMDDGNSDECYLCGMDGNLLCCDGCPAAFHSKCVGVVEDLLPEGDWYCPECLIQKNDGSRNMANLMRGAEVLGIDPHGRLYLATCGYLLVVDSCDVDSPCHYYGQIDLHSFVTVLNRCHPAYTSIINAISSFFGTAIESPNVNGRYRSSNECSSSDVERDRWHLSPLKQPSEHKQFNIEQENSPGKLNSAKDRVSYSDHLDGDVSRQTTTSRSTENQQNPSCQENRSDCHLHSDPARYINYYSFGQIAASASEELKHRLSENKEGKKPAQDVLSFHLRMICKKYANIYSLTDQKISVELLKEKCGWCNSCQISGGVDCIFRVTDVKCIDGTKPHAFGPPAQKNKESHIVLAIQSILSIEQRLNGLLTGPWQNPQYSDNWRKAVLKASDISSLKQPLLMLESSLRRLAISMDWHKPADSVEVVGSAAHILVRTSNKSSNRGSVKRPGRKPSSIGELKVDSRDVGVYWWRGGTLSRQVFHWKRLPQSLAHKAARQAGRSKIPTVLYPDGSQFARRLKYIAWRAAVEMAENVPQLILQIKEFEWNIKWTEILSTLPSSLETKETQKNAKLFKKVILRRKRIEGTNVEYLLDFGKRQNIPPVVSKHGTKFVEPSNERNRYWLSEGHVPLNLLKAYEAKSVARLLKKKETDDLPKKTKTRDSKLRKQKVSGFDYLFEKAKKLSIRLCGQCKKQVIAREAVNCQYCAALFHRKHFKVPRGATDAVYVCNKCLAEKVLKVKSPQKKAAKETSPRIKQKKQSRRMLTRRNQIVLKYQKKTGKQGKRGRPRKNPLSVSKNELPKVTESEPPNVPKNEPVKRLSKRLYDKYMKGDSNRSEHEASCRKRKRSALHHSYWLNGLRWTQNPNGERAGSFRKERVVLPSEDSEISDVTPVCCLCEECFSKKAIYIACEICEDWFHGDIYSITIENVNNLIGFKCHRCRLRSVPVCPYAQTATVLKAQSNKEHDINKFEEDKDYNCPEDLGAHDSQRGPHDLNIKERLNGHVIENELDSNDCLKVLRDHSNMNDVGSHSTEKELDEDRSLKELDAHSKLKVLDSLSSKKELDPNCLKELGSHNNVKDVGSHSTGNEDGRSLKELDGHNKLKVLDSTGSEKEFGPNCLKELDSHSNLKDLNDRNSQEELDGTKSSKFAAEEARCMEELRNFNSLKLDKYNSLEEFDNHSCPKENGNHNGSKEVDKNRSPKEFSSTEDSKFASATTHSGDCLAENFNNIKISGQEALVISSETGSVKESFDLQSKDNSVNSVPSEHEFDIQVAVTL